MPNKSMSLRGSTIISYGIEVDFLDINLSQEKTGDFAKLERPHDFERIVVSGVRNFDLLEDIVYSIQHEHGPKNMKVIKTFKFFCEKCGGYIGKRDEVEDYLYSRNKRYPSDVIRTPIEAENYLCLSCGFISRYYYR